MCDYEKRKQSARSQRFGNIFPKMWSSVAKSSARRSERETVRSGRSGLSGIEKRDSEVKRSTDAEKERKRAKMRLI